MKRRDRVLAGLVLMASTVGAIAQQTYLSVDPFADLTDLYRLTYPMSGGTGQWSSYDRTGGNADASFWYYLRGEPRRVVLADVRGPGCIWRIWVTAFDAHTARIEIFLDGSASPAVSTTMASFFGNYAPFVPPLASPASGAWVSYVPIPFRKNCRIEVINPRADNNVIYYNVSYRTYPPGEPLADIFRHPPTSAQQAHLNLFAQQWANVGNDPKAPLPGQQTITDTRFVGPGQTVSLASLGGAGMITGLRMTVNPDASDVRFYARIRARWDGSPTPAIDSPLGAFFGSVFGPTSPQGQTANATALALGTKHGQMYFYLPAPFSSGAVIELFNGSSVPFNASYSLTWAPKNVQDIGRMRLHADAFSRTCTAGSPSYTFANITGRGHFLGCTMGIDPLDPNLGALEGDELIYVNGENYASIRGTGTEDYFNGGFYFLDGPYSLPFSGCSIINPVYPLRVAVYRLSIPDAVVFRRGLLATMEHGGVNDANGHYHSTAFYYRDDAGGTTPAEPVHPPLAAQPLINGSFEGSFGGYNNGEAAGWMAYQSRTYYGAAGVCTFSAATDQAFDGSRSQKITLVAPPSAPASAGIAQQVQVARGSAYQITARLRLALAGGLSPGQVIPRLGIGTSGNMYHEDGSVSYTEAPSATGTWHTVSAVAVAQYDFLTIFLGAQYRTTTPGPATLWIDAVTIEPYTGPLPPPPLPVVDNFSFETGVVPWTMWTGAGSNGDGLETDYLGSAPHGNYVLAVKGIGTGGKGACQYVGHNWVTGRQYRLNVYVANLANSGMRYAIGHALGNTGPAGAGTAAYGPEVIGTSAWQRAYVQFTYTGTDEGVTIYLRAVHSGSSERAGFDRVYIEDITADGPPTIALAPAGFNRTVTQGGSLPADTFTVGNSGGGSMNYTIGTNVTWLSVNPSTGSSSGELDPIALNYHVSNLTPGTYQGTVTVSAAGATNSPQHLAVTLTVNPVVIPGDMDNDGDVDMDDFGRFQRCLSGLGVPQNDPACAAARLDGDSDVDTADLSLFRGCLSGAGVPGNPQCRP